MKMRCPAMAMAAEDVDSSGAHLFDIKTAVHVKGWVNGRNNVVVVGGPKAMDGRLGWVRRAVKLQASVRRKRRQQVGGTHSERMWLP